MSLTWAGSDRHKITSPTDRHRNYHRTNRLSDLRRGNRLSDLRRTPCDITLIPDLLPESPFFDCGNQNHILY